MKSDETLAFCSQQRVFPSPQANLQGVHRPADTGPLAARKLTTGPHYGTWNPRLPDPLQPHHPRLRLSGHLRRHDLTSELPERGAQTNGQDVSELWQRHSGILRKRKQIYRQNGQAPEMRAQRRIYTNTFPRPRCPVCPSWTFLNSALVDKYCHVENLCVQVFTLLNSYFFFFFELMMTYDLLQQLFSCRHLWRARVHGVPGYDATLILLKVL